MYQLTTLNLRTALGIESDPTLDEVRKKVGVWLYCNENVDEYLAAARGADPVEYVVGTESVLRDVITEQHEAWTEEQLRDVIMDSSPAAALHVITTAFSGMADSYQCGMSRKRTTIIGIHADLAATRTMDCPCSHSTRCSTRPPTALAYLRTVASLGSESYRSNIETSVTFPGVF